MAGERPARSYEKSYTVRDILRISVPILIEDVLRTLMGIIGLRIGQSSEEWFRGL